MRSSCTEHSSCGPFSLISCFLTLFPLSYFPHSFLSLFLRVSIKHLPIVGNHSLYPGLQAIRPFRPLTTSPTDEPFRRVPFCCILSLTTTVVAVVFVLVANLKVDLWLAVTKTFRLSNALRYFHCCDRAFVSGLG